MKMLTLEHFYQRHSSRAYERDRRRYLYRQFEIILLLGLFIPRDD